MLSLLYLSESSVSLMLESMLICSIGSAIWDRAPSISLIWNPPSRKPSANATPINSGIAPGVTQSNV